MTDANPQGSREPVAGVELRRSADRFVTATDWLDSRSSFSFGDHYDPAEVGFGALSVLNHEVLRSGTGFDDHPHADAEILTWVLSGSLLHEDSRGNSGITHRGLAQRMSAGSGIVHAERNDAYRIDPTRATVPAEYVQMWVRPDSPGLEPGYAQRPFDLGDLDTGWLPVASGSHPDAVIDIASAASTLWVTRLAAGEVRTVPVGRRAHLYLAAGSVEVESAGLLGAGDALKLAGDATAQQITGVGPGVAEVLVWQLG